ncbi:MAG: TRAP transporter permease [SAR324 cluster bacterium]|nr:TRAP transporter permease [SAR324 cluster bacterium]
MARSAVSDMDAGDIVAQVDTGARNPAGWQGRFILYVAFAWAVFQLYIASNVPFFMTDVTGIGLIVTDSNARLIHLAFAAFLAALAFPLLKKSPRDTIPWYDWVLGVLAVISCLYIMVFRDSIAVRAGLPTTADLVISTIGMVILAISVYRSLGLPLLVISSVFVIYVFFGSSEIFPDAIRWKGASYGKAMWHFWMQNEGVFGVALGVSARLIFLFVLFGAILEKAGAGNYFIKLAFALLGHYRGGPAKAAVVASAMSGLYSGSSIANVVTTGTFTIPLMKRTGFTAEKAGAVEVVASTNGQLMPPVMGAAAFLIAEFTGVPYTDILKHAVLPAVVSYIALVYIVHLEAIKMGLQGLKKPSSTMTLGYKLIGFLGGFIGISVLFSVVYFTLGWIDMAASEWSFVVAGIFSLVGYIVLLWIAAKRPDLEISDPDAPITELPRAGETAVTGLYYLLPIIILIWCILPTPDRLSPGLSAFLATLAMSLVALTHHPIKAYFRGTGGIRPAFMHGVREWAEGMISASRNMISIGIATGVAGIIIGTVSLTGLHQVIGSFVELLSGGNLLFMLILVAIMSLILGMGLPTTANYIIVSSLMAPIVVELGAKSGLIVPLVAVHLFVFYFGILADDTPPVGLAAFAASAISGGDPFKTGIQGFIYDIRTALLPFLFLFNTELLLMDVTPLKAVVVFVVAVIAMLLFAAATQHFFIVRSRIWETVALLLIAFTLFRPGFWLDRIDPPFLFYPGTEVTKLAGSEKAGGNLRIQVSGPDIEDSDQVSRLSLIIPLGGKGDGAARLKKGGMVVSIKNGQAVLEEPPTGTELEDLGRQFDFYGDTPVTVVNVLIPNDRIAKEVFYLPSALLLAIVLFLQFRRRSRGGGATQATT